MSQTAVTLWKLQGDDAIRVADLTLPLRDVLECGVISYKGEFFSFYRLEGSIVYFMLCGGILGVPDNDSSIIGHY